MIENIHHACICVRDMERSLALYQGVLGMEKVQDTYFEGPMIDRLLELQGARFRIVHLKVGGDILELMQFERPAGEDKARGHRVNDRGLTHFCFTVKDTEEVFRRLKAEGLAFTCDPVTTPTGRKVAYFRDPDGILVEILQEAGR
ncbi:MAG: VOC family protein [Candidatus Tectomicrobia bacterium]|uniref:VOC family protein n=1 Tax=Tectimicrobiota bacterium TaxID=2528274 RepID=A0A932MN49_UNCTE|nr:VOC family protein [Candidatus Tectomicrobia bacterium]